MEQHTAAQFSKQVENQESERPRRLIRGGPWGFGHWCFEFVWDLVLRIWNFKAEPRPEPIPKPRRGTHARRGSPDPAGTADRRSPATSSTRFLRGLAWIAVCLESISVSHAETRFTLSTMPRIDVHAHIRNDWKTMDDYMALREILKKQLNVEMALWISIGVRGQDPPDLEELDKRYNGRILFCISDYKISDGLRFSPQELVERQDRGIVGFKFYPGWERGVQVDHPANDPVFYKMEQISMVAASVHVADPSGAFGKRTEWFSEPVEFWRQQHAWENVLKKHPSLVVVNAHMLWLCYSDEQLDYLRYGPFQKNCISDFAVNA
jgi:hypothetical protein